VPHTQVSLAEQVRQQRKLLLWPILIAFVIGILSIGEPVEDNMRVLRNKLHPSAASGQIVLVQVDDKSIREVGDWPWPRSKQSRIYEELRQMGAKRISADIVYSGPTSTKEDRALQEALEGAANVALALPTIPMTASEWSNAKQFLATLAPEAQIVTISAEHNFQLAVWNVPRGDKRDGKIIPSLNTYIAGISPSTTTQYPIDFSINPDSVPTVSASDVYFGKISRSAFAGKSVVFGTNSEAIGDQYLIPGWGKRGGVYAQILGAETLLRGDPIDFGWFPAFLAALVGVVALIRSQRIGYLVLLATSLLVLQFILELGYIFLESAPALALILIAIGKLMWIQARAGGITNSLTGLPNLTALRNDREGRDLPLVAVRIHNYAEIASTLNANGEKEMVEQLVQRLTIGNREKRIYQGDEGIFAWFADKGTPFASHLEALHSLFRSPIKVGKTAFDIALSFGVELGSSRSISSRLGSALVAAQEADSEAIKWKLHDPARMQEVPWRLSLLSQLDEAIDHGQVWLAFQPKLDLATRRTVGVEALARWTHPEKGPISPSEFVSAAEQNNRIGYLTDFVLDRAISAVAAINREGHDLEVAVNLSARMLNDRDLPERVAGILAKHQFQATKLILELTETAAVTDGGSGIELLLRLRDLGVKIAIDDYGTGLSTLDYLKKVPASELKIDQSFIKAMRDNRSDLIMVQSTITLAHSLGRIVVAEGVEDPGSLEQLRSMGCDQAQGFIVGRPMSFEELTRRLKTERRRSAA
jgi:EAL domain-containing protein (putative c-di-GMP-specific phosphodiesterase class I)/CHASE2 domain-containing sensor protein